MKQFMDETVVDTRTAQDSFQRPPEMVANYYKFKSITELWLGGDPLQVACYGVPTV